ncbi:hypothetical protein [Actinomadura sp. 7K534]|uniref:hypothetical protein n=1 Tax=Actinomadura sp. 7K534 TaxID=2530366 RepID=UPI00104EC8D5|nr:hypothetical protein [Actinomadura sp. 7K534]TDB95675.1 hypothetical protein E1266_12345 [Actinomadura sp. 7K534]
MHTGPDLHARLARDIEAVRTLAGQVDSNGDDHVLDQLTRTGGLDDTMAFLRRAHHLLISITETLTLLIGAHDVYEDSSGQPDPRKHAKGRTSTPQDLVTVDAAEAWRRAHLHLTDHRDTSILLHIEEFEDGYRATPIPVSLPEAPRIPTLETPATLVINKTTGAVTRWPLLPLDVLANQYRRYARQEAMDFDESC